MKKLILFIPIIFLIIATTLTKDSTKKLDKKIFEVKENIRILEDLSSINNDSISGTGSLLIN